MEKSKLIKDDIGMIDEIIELLKQLVSMEAHAQASYKTTDDIRWLKVKDDIRKIRTEWLSMISKKKFGQVWCYDKHSCEAMMRLDEIQTRFLSTNQIEESIKCGEDYKIIFQWFIELNDLGKKDKGVISSA